MKFLQHARHGGLLGMLGMALALAACAPRTQAAPLRPTSDEAQVRQLVEDFGWALDEVPLAAPASLAAQAIREHYAPFVSAGLLSRWEAEPAQAPGRLTSSPWPDRIDIHELRRLDEGGYLVRGDIVLLTSVEIAHGGEAGRVPITLTVAKGPAGWRITDVALVKPIHL